MITIVCRRSVLRPAAQGICGLVLTALTACAPLPGGDSGRPPLAPPSEVQERIVVPVVPVPPHATLQTVEGTMILAAKAPQASAAEFVAAAPTTEAPPEIIPPAPVTYDSVATYYAKRFNGRRTFTGERYDPEGMTAASRDFPIGSRIRVVNPKNGREVTVRINDLPRKRTGPLIDLSRAAARQLGFLGKGKIRVRLIPLPSP